jgi:hypothetical protein
MNVRRQLLSVPVLGAAIAGSLSPSSFGGTSGVSAAPAKAAGTVAAGTVAAVSVATVTGALGGILCFVATSGSNLVLIDSDFANPVVIGTLAAPLERSGYQ